MIGIAAAGVGVGKKIYGSLSKAAQTAKYEAKMDPTWAAAAVTAVENHRRVGSPPAVWNGVRAAAPEGFQAYLPSDIWNPSPVRAPAGNEIPGNTWQGPRPGTEDEWVNGDHSSFPFPSASAAVGEAAAGPALAGIGGSSSTLLILAILALVLFTRIGKK